MLVVLRSPPLGPLPLAMGTGTEMMAADVAEGEADEVPELTTEGEDMDIEMRGGGAVDGPPGVVESATGGGGGA